MSKKVFSQNRLWILLCKWSCSARRVCEELIWHSENCNKFEIISSFHSNPWMRIIHVCSCKNNGVIPVIFNQMVSKNSGVDAPFQQKFKYHSSKMSCGHCNYLNAVFLRARFVFTFKLDLDIHITLYNVYYRVQCAYQYQVEMWIRSAWMARKFFLPPVCKICLSSDMTFYQTVKRFSIEMNFHR